MTILFITKALLGLLLIPVFIGLYANAAKNAGGSLFARWAYKNAHFYVLILLCGSALFAEWVVYGAEHPKHQDQDLEFFNLAVYTAELDKCNNRDQEWPNTKTFLLRRFEHAEYAWRLKDYKETVSRLMIIKSGRDTYGDFVTAPSYVINNNLGCSTFKLQRNRGFAAAAAFQEARALAPNGSAEAAIIERNIQLLDQMVNRFD